MSRPAFNQTWLLPIFLILIAVLASLLAMLSPERPVGDEPLANCSIYHNGPTGYRAWYLASKKSGIPILTWERSFTHLDELPAPATMVMVEPYTVAKSSILFGKKEGLFLLKWVEEGNTLLLLDPFTRYGSDFMADILSLKVQAHRNQQQPSDSNRNPVAQPVSMTAPHSMAASFVHRPLMSETRLSFKTDPPDKTGSSTLKAHVLLEDRAHHPLMIRIPYGKGTIILGTTGDMGSNRFLHTPANDNYQFLSNLLLQEKKPIFVNEFVHGYMEAGDLMSYYQKHTPLGPIFAQFFLAFMVLLWLSFIRWTPKPAETKESLNTESSSGLDAYIQSLAGIYYRTQSSTLAISPLLHQIETLLHQKFRVAPNEDSQLQHLLGTVFADYSNKDESPDLALEALRKARSVVRRQERLPQRDLLKLAQQLTSIEERLRLYGQRHHAIRQ